MLGPNINAPMEPAVNLPALAAVERAQALAANASDKEQALIAALAKRYSADPKVERAALDRAWADVHGTGVAFVEKPFLPAEVRRRIAEAVERQP